MGKYAVIQNGEVVNVIVAEPDFAIEGAVLVEIALDSLVSIGWAHAGGEFTAPQEPTPSSGTMPITEL